MGEESVLAYNKVYLFLNSLRGNGALHSLAAVSEDSPRAFATRLTLLLLQAPGRCRGSSRVVLKAAPGIGDQRRVLLKPLRKPIFVVRSRNSRRSSVGAGPPIVSLKTIKIQRFRCHFVMV